MSAIFSIGVFFAFFMGVLLFSKKGRTIPDIILGIWMCVIGAHLLAYHLYYLGYWEVYPHLFGTTAMFPLLHAPLLFLYTSYSLNGHQKFRSSDYLHFTPTLLSYIHLFHIYFFYSVEMKIDLDNGVIDDSLFIGVLLSFLVLSSFIYTIISYGLVRKYKKILKHNFSFDERINLRWLQLWILGFASIFFVIAGVVLLRNAIGYVFGFNIDLVFYTMVISLVLILGYFGISHEGIFAKTVVLVDRKQDLSYKKSGLKEEEVKGVKAKLQIVISEEKPYLNPKLTLSGLAKLVGTTPNTLSQVLNHYEKVNFYDFINVYRIEEFKRQAAKNPNFTILALAYDAGFNSKSSFNGLFKKHTGITPSKYISTVHTKA